ncbi:hypothetical protein [Paraburkholderia sp. J10-1]|uniref:hypothetical protein n=1 Tax=Paraburkholderia sp. J10-1 TaxID=2805430 RepID=UPI002AB68955|nr:hypothetical protein [Paraburkholderia sp. J10-1]
MSFLQAGAGTVTRTMQDKVRERISFADFGCDATGSTDVTSSVQAALNYAESARCVIECQGWERYLISSTVYVRVPAILRMNGARFVSSDGFKADAFNYNNDPCYPCAVICADASQVSDIGWQWSIAVEGPYGGRKASKPPNIPMNQYTVLDGVLITGDFGQVSEMDVRVWSEGFRDCVVVGGAHVYLNKLEKPHVGKAWRRGWRFTRTTDTGENFSIYGGVTANCVNSAGTAVALYEDGTTNGDYNIHGHSLDYCDSLGYLQSGRWAFYGCHFENNNNNPHFRIFKSAQMPSTRLEIYGGSFGSGNGGASGNYIPTENVSGRPYFIGLNGGVSLYFVGLIAAYNRYNTSIAVVESGVPQNVSVRGDADTGSNQQPGLANPYAGNSLLYNGSFESGTLDGWTLNGSTGNSVAISTIGAHSGTSCLTLSLTNGNSGCSASQDVAARAGEAILVAGWVNVAAVVQAGQTGYASIRVQLITQAGLIVGDLNLGTYSASTGGYAQIGGRVIVPTGVATLRLSCYATHMVGTVSFDDLFACPI